MTIAYGFDVEVGRCVFCVDFVKVVIGFESLGVMDFGVEKLLMFFLRRIVNVFVLKIIKHKNKHSN